MPVAQAAAALGREGLVLAAAVELGEHVVEHEDRDTDGGDRHADDEDGCEGRHVAVVPACGETDPRTYALLTWAPSRSRQAASRVAIARNSHEVRLRASRVDLSGRETR